MDAIQQGTLEPESFGLAGRPLLSLMCDSSSDYWRTKVGLAIVRTSRIHLFTQSQLVRPGRQYFYFSYNPSRALDYFAQVLGDFQAGCDQLGLMLE